MKPLLLLALLFPVAAFASGPFGPPVVHVDVPRATGIAAIDTANINSAIAQAGAGGVVEFPGGQTQDYEITNTPGVEPGANEPYGVLFDPNQTVYFNGAVLQRANQVTTTTTESYAANDTGGSPTSVTVTDGALFSAGDVVTIANEATCAYYHYTSIATITSVTGNTLTFAGPPSMGSNSGVAGTQETTGCGVYQTETSYTFPIGSTVAKVYDTVAVQDGDKLHGLHVDGNMANQVVAHWDLYTEVKNLGLAGSDQVTVFYNPVVENYASESIVEHGGGTDGSGVTGTAGVGGYTYPGNKYNEIYYDPIIENGGGNGIHFSAISHAEVVGGYIYNINQDWGVGHVNGCLTMSRAKWFLTVRGLVCDRAVAGISALNALGDGYIKITDSNFLNLQYSVFYNFNNALTTGHGKYFIFSGNYVFDGGNVELYDTDGTSSYVPDLDYILSHNNFVGTNFTFEKYNGITFAHNTIDNQFVLPVRLTVQPVANATTITVAALGGLYQGETIDISGSGEVSHPFLINSISGSGPYTLRLDSAITSAEASGWGAVLPWVNDYLHIAVTETTLTASMAGATSLTVNDASIFQPNEMVCVYDVTTTYNTARNGNACSEIVSIAANTLTLTPAIPSNVTSASGDTVYVFAGIDPQSMPDAGIALVNSASQIDGNTILGAAIGININDPAISASSPNIPMIVGNKLRNQTTYGIRDNGAATSQSDIHGNAVIAGPLSSASGWTGMYLEAKDDAEGNYFVTTASGQHGIYFGGTVTDPLAIGNLIYGPATGMIDVSASTVTGAVIEDNGSSGSATSTGACAASNGTGLLDSGTSTVCSGNYNIQ